MSYPKPALSLSGKIILSTLFATLAGFLVYWAPDSLRTAFAVLVGGVE